MIIVAVILVGGAIGFFYFISINGFSTYHAGIYVEILSENQLEGFGTDYEIKTISKEDLMQFPEIHTMVNLLLEERENPQGTRSFFVDFNTYRIFDSHGELKIKNHMSDSGATNLHRDFTMNYEFNVFKFEGDYFSITTWIA